jgi:hypothetical protein
MKFAALVFALALAFSATGASAHEEGPAPRHSEERMPEGVSVPAWRELTPEQQEKLAPLRERWDQMPASRRVHALERMERRARWDAMTPEQRDRLRHGARNFRDLPPELREKMRESMKVVRQLPEAQRNELQQRWRAMDPEQRRQWLEAGGPGLAPPPEG